MFRTLTTSLLACALLVPASVLAQDAAPADAGKAGASSTVDINTATAAQLTGLPGIGAKTAERIIEYREKNGPFKKIEDLMNVKGIGEKSFLKLKPRLTASSPSGSKN
jgi:competence protein ComEA